MEAYLISVARQALYLTLILSAPPVGAALIVGLVISLVQATTQVQEQTLTFVPKLIIVLLVLSMVGPWAFYQLASYATSIITTLPTYFH